MFEVIDPLKLYIGYDYEINPYITIHQPTIGEIINFGEEGYYNAVFLLCSIPDDMKSQLWDEMKLDWTKVSDYELFLMTAPSLTPDTTSLLLGDIDLSKLVPLFHEESQQVVLYDQYSGLKIDKSIYTIMVDYLRKMHNLEPKRENPLNAYTKRVLLDEDRQRRKKAKLQKKESMLLPLISSMVNSAEFKYKKSELLEVGLVEFMDSVSRIQAAVNAKALLQGCYSGMIDASKIDKKNINWMRSLSTES